jgi:hypothetical protein
MGFSKKNNEAGSSIGAFPTLFLILQSSTAKSPPFGIHSAPGAALDLQHE